MNTRIHEKPYEQAYYYQGTPDLTLGAIGWSLNCKYITILELISLQGNSLMLAPTKLKPFLEPWKLCKFNPGALEVISDDYQGPELPKLTCVYVFYTLYSIMI